MRESDEPVADSFWRHVGALGPVAIYGTGLDTQAILASRPQAATQIVGLLDPAFTGQTVFGAPVLSLEDAAARGARAIVVVARPSSTRIIERRIAADCGRLDLPVYSVRGERLALPTRAATSAATRAVAGPDVAEVRRRIDEATHVSFDVFDTLLTRRVLEPGDVFDLVARRLLEVPGAADLVEAGGFRAARAGAERAAGVAGPPTLAGIYDRLGADLSWPADLVRRCMDLELAVEREVLCPRTAVVELFDYAGAAGKPVTLISDMYLPEGFLREVLAAGGVTGYQGLLVSGTRGAGKADGLFAQYTEGLPPGARPLHIGDNETADGRHGRAAGLDTIILESGLTMLAASPAAPLLDLAHTVGDRLSVGMFVASAFNDPFLFARTGGHFEVSSAAELGRLTVAPVICAFMDWFVAALRAGDLTDVLLAARDGHLIERLYPLYADAPGDRSDPPHPPLPRAHYFYTSRLAAVLAAITTSTDIADAAELAFSGPSSDLLTNRFGLEPHQVLPPEPDESATDHVARHTEQILARAAHARRNYLAYLRTLPLTPGGRVGFFDFVSSGTCQAAVEKIAGLTLSGLYFLRLPGTTNAKRALSVQAPYALAHHHDQGPQLYDDYLFLENFLSSPQPSLAEFDATGAPVFLAEGRSADDLAFLQEVHDEIVAYAATRLRLLPGGNTQDDLFAVPGRLLSLLGEATALVAPGLFEGRELADEFCRRSVAWSEVIPR